jgi:hypothetical protein
VQQRVPGREIDLLEATGETRRGADFQAEQCAKRGCRDLATPKRWLAEKR